MKAIDKQTKEIEVFIKESMCIDGTVKYDNPLEISTSYGKVISGALFEIRDKKRGRFYIAWLK